MPLPQSDLDSIYNDMWEVYEEVFNSEVEFLEFDTTSNALTNNIYDENKFLKFKTAVKMVAKVIIKSETIEIEDSGAVKRDEACFHFPLKSWEDAGLDEKTESLILKSRIKYNSIIYEIVNITPTLILNDIIFKYIVDVKKVL